MLISDIIRRAKGHCEGTDALVTMEFIDFTTCEYVRDAAMLG